MKPRKVKAKIVFNLQETPHWRIVLPADIASYDAMVEQMADAMTSNDGTARQLTQFALAAIGITRPKEKKQ